MDVLNKTDIQGCFYYENGAGASVEIRNLKQQQEEEVSLLKNEIAFILEGEMRLAFRNLPEKILGKGDFVFIPVRGVFRYTVLKETLMIIFRLNGNIKLCDGCRLEDLYKTGKTALKSTKNDVCILKANPPLRHFLYGVNATVAGGLNCRYYYDLKVKELFVLLKVYYPRESLRGFFSRILSPDTLFSEYVRANHHKYKTSKELAEAMNITPKLFSRKFSKIFGEPAIGWMMREKALCIYSELHTGSDPIAQVADKYWFSSQSHLHKFCKREFGKTPGEIRYGAKV